MRLRDIAAVVVMLALMGACAKKQPPVARPTPPPTAAPSDISTTRPPTPPEPAAVPMGIPMDPVVTSDELSSRSVDEINRESPFQPVFFALDSETIEGAALTALQNNADILRQYGTWTVTIEGHADIRGTPEYNLALGERRALAARNYLIGLGITPDRMKIVSYGSEFPFDPGNTEDAYSKNRRAHFVVTAK